MVEAGLLNDGDKSSTLASEAKRVGSLSDLVLDLA